VLVPVVLPSGELEQATAAVATIASTAAEVIMRFFLAYFKAILRPFRSSLHFAKPGSQLSLARISESAPARAGPGQIRKV
jgi:hypothetical protein